MPSTSHFFHKERRRYLYILFALSLSFTYLHYLLVDYPFAQQRWAQHSLIVSRQALSPYRYRVMAPYLAQGIGHLAHVAVKLDLRKAVLAAYVLIQFVSMFIGLSLFQFYLERWFPRREALVGTLFVAAIMPFTFIHYFLQPWGHPEFITYILGMWCIVTRRYAWLWIVLVISTLNRETSIFLAFLFFVCNYGQIPSKKLFSWTAIYAFSWLAVYGSLRRGLGWAKHVTQNTAHPLTYRLIRNIKSPDAYFTVAIFFGIFWYLAFADGERKPLVLRRALWFVPVFFAVYLVFATIHEVRYFLLLCPIVVPLGLMSLFGEKRDWSASEGGAAAALGDAPVSKNAA